MICFEHGKEKKTHRHKPACLSDRAGSHPGTSRAVAIACKEKNPAAVALGRLGGLKGGRARAEKLSAKRLKEIAEKQL